MGHLKYGAGGHLLRNAAGHLVHICEGPTATPTAVNDCNSCSPPLRDSMFVTLALCADDFGYNGKWAIDWDFVCTWRHYFGVPGARPYFELYWNGTQNDWFARILAAAGNCDYTWRSNVGGGGWGHGEPCDPTQAFAFWQCVDPGCIDSDSCEDSAGATCVVSLT